jgi:hypothetical protein
VIDREERILSSLAIIELRAEEDGVAVIPLDLYPTLRVSKVETEKGEAHWILCRKDKEDDPDFGVMLATPLKKGETATVKITMAARMWSSTKGRKLLSDGPRKLVSQLQPRPG